ncbi:MAG: hypothetical protein AAF757_26950, partial [Cyanobacteria bacterium P01_D01_bin.116]
MQSLHRVSTEDLQRFLDAPEELLRETRRIQIFVASFPETPRNLLEVLVNSHYSEVVEVARLHVNWVNEERGDYREAVSEVLRDKDLGENDRLAVELMKFAPVAPEFLSEWVPVDKLIQGLKNQYMPLRYRLKLLEKLSREGELEARLQVAESLETPVSILELLAGDIDLAVRLAVEYNGNCPLNVVELVKSQHDLASDWDTDVRYLEELGKSRWGSVRFAVAQNPYASEDVLMKLAGDNEFRIRFAVAKNPGTSAGVLNVLMESDTGIYGVIAKNPNATEEILLELFSDNKDLIYKKNNLPKVMNDLTPQWMEVLPNLPNESVKKVVKRLIEILDTINYEVNFRSVAVAVVGNPNTPSSIRKRLQTDFTQPLDIELSHSSDNNMLFALAYNSQVPEAERMGYFQQIIADGRSYEIAEDARTPVHILEQLLLSEKDNKISVAENLATPEYLLRKIAHECNERLWEALAENPNTPADLLVSFLNEEPEHKLYRLASIFDSVIENPNLPVLTRYCLSVEKENLEYIAQVNKFMARRSDSLENDSYKPLPQQTSITLSELPRIYNSNNDDLA